MEGKSQNDKDFFDLNGYWPVSDDSVSDEEKVVLTPEQIEIGEQLAVRSNAKQYLQETDWYATRFAETGKAIPDDVLALRAQARIDASEG